MRVVICGGGVIGACTAYFLSRRVEVVVVERTGIACAASGKSGGFLARDWCDGTPLAALARRSFDLHAELATRIGGWDYRRLDTLAVAASARRPPRRSAGALPDWVGPDAALQQQLGTPRTTAQVHPQHFTRGMMQAAIAGGARVQTGAVTGLVGAAEGRVAGVLVDGAPLAADAVLIALGPWSLLACRWLPLPLVYGLKGHSVIVQSGAASPHALFVECETEDGAVHAPEVFPRPDGTTYVCGLSSQAPLPLDPASVATDAEAQAALKAMLRSFAPRLAEAHVVAAQACYRPVTQDGLPLMGAVPGVAGAYVTTGHSVWGMLNGPASGEAMAGMITGADTTVDLAPFDPARLPALPGDAIGA